MISNSLLATAIGLSLRMVVISISWKPEVTSQRKSISVWLPTMSMHAKLLRMALITWLLPVFLPMANEWRSQLVGKCLTSRSKKVSVRILPVRPERTNGKHNGRQTGNISLLSPTGPERLNSIYRKMVWEKNRFNWQRTMIRISGRLVGVRMPRNWFIPIGRTESVCWT